MPVSSLQVLRKLTLIMHHASHAGGTSGQRRKLSNHLPPQQQAEYSYSAGYSRHQGPISRRTLLHSSEHNFHPSFILDLSLRFETSRPVLLSSQWIMLLFFLLCHSSHFVEQHVGCSSNRRGWHDPYEYSMWRPAALSISPHISVPKAARPDISALSSAPSSNTSPCGHLLVVIIMPNSASCYKALPPTTSIRVPSWLEALSMFLLLFLVFRLLRQQIIYIEMMRRLTRHP